MKTYKMEIEIQVGTEFANTYPHLVKDEKKLLQYALIHARIPVLERGTLYYDDGAGMGLRIVVSGP